MPKKFKAIFYFILFYCKQEWENSPCRICICYIRGPLNHETAIHPYQVTHKTAPKPKVHRNVYFFH